MRNPFNRSSGPGYPSSIPSTSFNKLKIAAAVITFVVIIVVMFESAVVIEAGNRGVVLYVGAVENRVLGPDYADRIIAPTIQESVKASVAKFNAEELITKRATAKAVIADSISKTLAPRNIIVETVFITDFSFSPAFAKQIESKVVAYQNYLTEQNNLLAVRVIANQTVVQAQAAARSNVAKANGEFQAIKIISSQLKQSPEYLQWMAINKWNGQMPYALGTGTLPFFQLPRSTTQQNQSNSSSNFAGGHS
jgi:regulator of protease activity HflC (stomatin/prohibitin superfamily)